MDKELKKLILLIVLYFTAIALITYFLTPKEKFDMEKCMEDKIKNLDERPTWVDEHELKRECRKEECEKYGGHWFTYAGCFLAV